MINCTLPFPDYWMHTGFASPDKSSLLLPCVVPLAFDASIARVVLTYREWSVQCHESGPYSRGDSGRRGEEFQKVFPSPACFSEVPNCFTFTGS